MLLLARSIRDLVDALREDGMSKEDEGVLREAVDENERAIEAKRAKANDIRAMLGIPPVAYTPLRPALAELDASKPNEGGGGGGASLSGDGGLLL